MAINSYFFNAVQTGETYDRTYNAEDVTSYLDLLVGNGVFPNPSTNLQVRAGGGMTVIAGAGQGWIDGHKIINTADMQLTIAQSDVVLNRIDAVIFYVDYTAREMGIAVKTGTAAASPVAPTLTRSTTRYEMCLATISVTKQVTEITASMITDTRGNSNLCGYVQGLIQQVDTTTLFDQWQAGFDDWFSTVKDTLSTSTLLRKFEYTHITAAANESTWDITKFIRQFSYPLDVLTVNINGLTLNVNEYSLDGSTITLNTPIAEANVPITFTVYKSVDGTDAVTVIEQVEELQNELDTMFDASLLYQSTEGVFPDANAEIVPTKKLSECHNGWLLTFSGYNDVDGWARNTFVHTVMIPKLCYTGENWNGASIMEIFPYAYNSSNETISQCVKQFQVFDDKLVSASFNATGDNRNIVLRSIEEF